MGISENGNGSQIFSQTFQTQLVFSIGGDTGERYTGSYSEDSDHFIAVSDSGKKVYVEIRDIVGEGADTIQSSPEIDNIEKYPHIQMPLTVFTQISKEFTCYPMTGKKEELADVIFHKNMPLSARMILSLSLAAAASELEEVFEQLQVKQLTMDAFLVNPENYHVQIDCAKLKKDLLPEERSAQYRKMEELGLMPAEWFEDSEKDPANVQTLRHMLAVCLFRILCAEDPFDGAYTLYEHPFKGKGALCAIYGKNAQYVLNRNNSNRANMYIGSRAYTIFNCICPRMKKYFELALVNGVANPEKRPSSAAWAENQKYMVSWFMVHDKEWRVADLVDGAGAYDGVKYLEIDNGIIIPLVQDKPVYQFMFDPSDAPINEKLIGKVNMQGFRQEIILNDANKTTISLNSMFQVNLPGERKGKVTEGSWKNRS